MSDGFDAFAAALRVRDLISECRCCPDDVETQERFETAEQLLMWVVETRAEMAAMRALETGVAKREPLTAAQRSARYRASKNVTKSVTKTVTERHENRHAAVTPIVTDAPRASESSSENSQSSSAIRDLSGESESARERHENRHEERDATRDGSIHAFDRALWGEWLAAIGNVSGAAPSYEGLAKIRAALPADLAEARRRLRAAADAYVLDCANRKPPAKPRFHFFANDIADWLAPTPTASGVPGPVSPARRLLSPPREGAA